MVRLLSSTRFRTRPLWRRRASWVRWRTRDAPAPGSGAPLGGRRRHPRGVAHPRWLPRRLDRPVVREHPRGAPQRRARRDRARSRQAPLRQQLGHRHHPQLPQPAARGGPRADPRERPSPGPNDLRPPRPLRRSALPARRGRRSRLPPERARRRPRRRALPPRSRPRRGRRRGNPRRRAHPVRRAGRVPRDDDRARGKPLHRHHAPAARHAPRGVPHRLRLHGGPPRLRRHASRPRGARGPAGWLRRLRMADQDRARQKHRPHRQALLDRDEPRRAQGVQSLGGRLPRRALRAHGALRPLRARVAAHPRGPQGAPPPDPLRVPHTRGWRPASSRRPG